MTDFGLAVSVDPANGLAVVARVPGGVEDDDAVCSDQVDAQTLRNQEQERVSLKNPLITTTITRLTKLKAFDKIASKQKYH